jgi:peptide/nickel transport system permease protein
MSTVESEIGLLSGEPQIEPGPVPKSGLRARHPVLWFVVRRVAIGVLTLIVASILIFLATNALPGNVADVVLGKNATPASKHALEAKLELNTSLVSRYLNWMGGAVHGDLGQSAVAVAQSDAETSVSSLISTPLTNSVILAGISAIILFPIALLLGALTAFRAGRPSDYAVSYLSLIFGALPEFVLGTLLITIFFTALALLPPVSLVPPGTSPLADPEILVLPVATLLGVSLAFCVRQVRAGVITALRQDYVTMARLSGLRERRVLFRYAVRNALAPSVQSFAQTMQYLFGGILIVETLFTYPGLGALLVQSVSARDVTMVQGITLVLIAAYIAINIIADLIVVLIVPRLRTGGAVR